MFWIMVGLDGLEPSTSRLSGVRSNHLSYKPIQGYSSFSKDSPQSRGVSLFLLIGAAGFEPAALWSQTRCATKLRYAPFFLSTQLAGDEGIEPPLMVLETTVMPLDQSPIFHT